MKKEYVMNFQIILIAFSFILFCVMIGMAFLNLGSENNIEILKPIIGGLLAGLFFVLSSFLVPIQSIKSNTNVVVLLAPQGQVVPFEQEILKLNFSKDSDNLGMLETYPNSLEFAKEETSLVKDLNAGDESYTADLTEWSFFSWMEKNCRGQRLNAGSIDYGISSAFFNREEVGNMFKEKEVLLMNHILSNNRFSKNNPVVIYLPKGTKVSHEEGNFFPKLKEGPSWRTIKFNNDNISLLIKFESGNGGGAVGGSTLGKKILAKFGLMDNSNYVFEHHVTVSFELTPSRWRRWSPLTTEEIEWGKEVMKKFNDAFSFEVLRPKLEKAYGI
jgi:hypothetical protein